jgi:hypothetical protein
MKANHTRYIRILFALILVQVPLIGLTQEEGSCAENLKTAQTLFERGQVEKVPAILYRCMKSDFKREEQLAAYKLIIQSYLLEDQIEQADSAMLSFLKGYPEYQLSQTDHQSFVSLYNSFRVRSLAQVAIHIGTNIPFLTNIKIHTISPEPTKSFYSSEALNLFTSVEVKVPINSKFEANIEAGFLQSKFRNTEKFLGYVTEYTESMQRLEIPLTVTWNFAQPWKKLTAFTRAGAGPVFNLASTATTNSTGTDDNNHVVISGADLDRTGSRIFTDLFLQAGAGIKYKIPGGFISLEVRSDFGMRDQVLHKRDDSTLELADRYLYSDDEFNINNLNINIGYTQIFFKPSKRKQGE